MGQGRAWKTGVHPRRPYRNERIGRTVHSANYVPDAAGKRPVLHGGLASSRTCVNSLIFTPGPGDGDVSRRLARPPGGGAVGRCLHRQGLFGSDSHRARDRPEIPQIHPAGLTRKRCCRSRVCSIRLYRTSFSPLLLGVKRFDWPLEPGSPNEYAIVFHIARSG